MDNAMFYRSLEYLHQTLKKKRMSLYHARNRAGCVTEEVRNLESHVEILEWLIGVVMQQPMDKMEDHA